MCEQDRGLIGVTMASNSGRHKPNQRSSSARSRAWCTDCPEAASNRRYTNRRRRSCTVPCKALGAASIRELALLAQLRPLFVALTVGPADAGLAACHTHGVRECAARCRKRTTRRARLRVGGAHWGSVRLRSIVTGSVGAARVGFARVGDRTRRGAAVRRRNRKDMAAAAAREDSSATHDQGTGSLQASYVHPSIPPATGTRKVILGNWLSPTTRHRRDTGSPPRARRTDRRRRIGRPGQSKGCLCWVRPPGSQQSTVGHNKRTATDRI